MKMNMLRNTQFCKTLFLGAVFFCTFLMAAAQYYIKILAPNVDTLYAKLQDANDMEKMKLCNELAFFYSLSDVDSAFHKEKKQGIIMRHSRHFGWVTII